MLCGCTSKDTRHLLLGPKAFQPTVYMSAAVGLLLACVFRQLNTSFEGSCRGLLQPDSAAKEVRHICSLGRVHTSQSAAGLW
jgi:hypothetical protein